MKAYVYHGEKKFSIDEVPKPKAQAGQAVAKVLCASICGTDLRTYRFGNAKLKTSGMKDAMKLPKWEKALI
jgi:L-iditol 2-dehydrogenase